MPCLFIVENSCILPGRTNRHLNECIKTLQLCSCIRAGVNLLNNQTFCFTDAMPSIFYIQDRQNNLFKSNRFITYYNLISLKESRIPFESLLLDLMDFRCKILIQLRDILRKPDLLCTSNTVSPVDTNSVGSCGNCFCES